MRQGSKVSVVLNVMKQRKAIKKHVNIHILNYISLTFTLLFVILEGTFGGGGGLNTNVLNVFHEFSGIVSV